MKFVFVCVYVCMCDACRCMCYVCVSMICIMCVLCMLQATVLEEMPAFPEKKSSLLNKLYETAPWTAKLHQQDEEATSSVATTSQQPTQEAAAEQAQPVVNGAVEPMLNLGQPVDQLINTSKPV